MRFDERNIDRLSIRDLLKFSHNNSDNDNNYCDNDGVKVFIGKFGTANRKGKIS